MVIGSIFGSRNITAVGYRSPESGQEETYAHTGAVSATWTVIYTVPAGKTFFLSTFAAYSAPGGQIQLGTGGSGSEVIVFTAAVAASGSYTWNFQVPMGFPAGTILSVQKVGGVGVNSFTLIGWIE